MRPLIGITSSYKDEKCELRHGYWRAVESAGGLPVVMPPIEEENARREMLHRLDGIVVSGGADVPPERYGEEPHPQTKCVPPRTDGV